MWHRLMFVCGIAAVSSAIHAAPFKGLIARFMELPPYYSKTSTKEAIDLEACVADVMGRNTQIQVAAVVRGRGIVYISGQVLLTTLKDLEAGGTLVEIRGGTGSTNDRAARDVDLCLNA